MPDEALQAVWSGATLGLLERTQAAADEPGRRFVLLNASHEVWRYTVAALWLDGRLAGHSGVGEVERHGPYALWLERLAAALRSRPPGPVDAAALPPELAESWSEWWPAHALWCPLPATPGTDAPGALLLVRDLPWPADEGQAVLRWTRQWHAAVTAARASAAQASDLRHWLRLRPWRRPAEASSAPRRNVWMLIGLLALCCVPVRLTVRAPGELVPRDPVVVRAAVEGTVRQLRVEPNQRVKAGQVLAELDDAGWASRVDVARQALLTAEAEWRQTSQQALNDPKAKGLLAAAQGKVAERQAELGYAEEQARRTLLLAPVEGVVLIQDPGSWPGRTVGVGEALMKLARPEDQEIEAWLAAGDAVDLPQDAPMRLHLDSHPTAPVTGRLRLFAYEAEHRPDLGLGYRLRGRLEAPSDARLGARGTVRIDGDRVPLLYWILRRPLAALRESTGW